MRVFRRLPAECMWGCFIVSEICWPVSNWEFCGEARANEWEHPDTILTRRLQERDPQALAELYDRYGRVAYAVVFRAVHDATITEDLVQEIFLRVWTHAGSFDRRRGTLGTWITAVARNRAIDYLRSSDGRMAASAMNLEGTEDLLPLFETKDEALAINRKRCLEKAFQKLTPSQREVIRLAYYEGLSQSEMACRLKQPLGTVKSWVRTALCVLREELA
jgi:RNA polymerase sigma-70 factor, ECF subfamily